MGCCAMGEKKNIVVEQRGGVSICDIGITDNPLFLLLRNIPCISIDQGKNISGVKFCYKHLFIRVRVCMVGNAQMTMFGVITACRILNFFRRFTAVFYRHLHGN
jgi:hypothetical protein